MSSARRTKRSQVTQLTNPPAAEVSISPISEVSGVPQEVGHASPTYQKTYEERMNGGFKNSGEALKELEAAYPEEWHVLRHATPLNGRPSSKPDTLNMAANVIHYYNTCIMPRVDLQERVAALADFLQSQPGVIVPQNEAEEAIDQQQHDARPSFDRGNTQQPAVWKPPFHQPFTDIPGGNVTNLPDRSVSALDAKPFSQGQTWGDHHFPPVHHRIPHPVHMHTSNLNLQEQAHPQAYPQSPFADSYPMPIPMPMPPPMYSYGQSDNSGGMAYTSSSNSIQGCFPVPMQATPTQGIASPQLHQSSHWHYSGGEGTSQSQTNLPHQGSTGAPARLEGQLPFQYYHH